MFENERIKETQRPAFFDVYDELALNAVIILEETGHVNYESMLCGKESQICDSFLTNRKKLPIIRKKLWRKRVMPIESPQKIKLVKLMEILHQGTDETHAMTTNEICSRLEKMGISCDRRTLSKDIGVLNANGYEIMSRMVGHEKAYYIDDRNFSIPELKILMDAVQAASFITRKKTEELTQKIAALASDKCAESLRESMVCFNARKHSNEHIYYSVDMLEEALREQRQVSFLYFDLDEAKRKIYRKEKRRYIVDPVALVYNEDNYYLMCYAPKNGRIYNYRVDRMEAVQMEDDGVDEKAVIHASGVADYTEQAFKMYNGAVEFVTLEFGREIIGAVYDKFGEDTEITCGGDGRYAATVAVQISPTFWGWVFQFSGRMKIVAPAEIREEMKVQIELLFQSV